MIAARSPADAFDCAIEACRIATRYMTPVMLLTDGYIANAAEPWKVPDMSGYAPFPVSFAPEQRRAGQGEVMPYARNADLARPWIKPGTPGLEHRIGGIEKAPGTGNIDYSPEAHAEMTRHPRRQGRRRRGLDSRPGCLPRQRQRQAGGGRLGLDLRPDPPGGAPRAARGPGRQPHPHPPHRAAARKISAVLLKGFEHILVPEMNSGQLKTVLRDQFLVDARPLNKVSGQPFQHRRDRSGDRGVLWDRRLRSPTVSANFETFAGDAA